MLIHVTMLFLTIYLIYHILVTLGYITLLYRGLEVLSEPELEQQMISINAPVVNQFKNVAPSEYVVWKSFWLPALFFATLHTLWLWILFAVSAEINQIYLIVSTVITSGLLTKLYTKNFYSDWMSRWLVTVEVTQQTLILKKLKQRLADIKITLEKIVSGDLRSSLAEIEALKVESTQLIQMITICSNLSQDTTTTRID